MRGPQQQLKASRQGERQRGEDAAQPGQPHRRASEQNAARASVPSVKGTLPDSSPGKHHCSVKAESETTESRSTESDRAARHGHTAGVRRGGEGEASSCASAENIPDTLQRNRKVYSVHHVRQQTDTVCS